MAFRFPYLALDIETTGLDTQRSHVLQLAAVYDNGKALGELATFNCVIKWASIYYANEWALNTNQKLLERGFKNDRVYTLEDAQLNFELFLKRVQPSGRVTAAGKNAGGFDLPILTNQVNRFALNRINRRVLDPGSMFTEEFDHIPSQDEINKFLGREAVSHDALEDCWDVVHAIRYKWGM
jgi:oligoribonuclease (3'-5' exoribonuclease)